MERVLSEHLPVGGKADLKTLAALAGVTRTGFYPKKSRDGTARPGAYRHLAEEFERWVKGLQDAGQIVDPRAAQIERLEKEDDELRKRIAARDAATGTTGTQPLPATDRRASRARHLTELTGFKILAISRLAAQHDETERLRKQAANGEDVRSLPVSRIGTAPYGSCS
ncbi:hypothetical protein ACFYWN_37245 [Streptomyces sp. NPDC002917]|uniref:hypothetical protein n=1 Tax=Streptomyces sp. NPDC002917 TaxID=3364671 RepID=UPI0036D14630